MTAILPSSIEDSVEVLEEADELFIHPNLKLLSHSSQVVLHSCGRKFFLYRLLNPKIAPREEDIHTDFGKLVGYGTQLIFMKKHHYIPMFAAWHQDLEEDLESSRKKSFFHALHAVDKFSSEVLNVELREYDLVYFDTDRPAIELGFSIDCGNGFSYRGKMDALLRHRETGEFAVWEGKTTGSNRVHEAMYKNSAQGLGYSVVVDAIAVSLGEKPGQNYKVIYGVYKSSQMEWELLEFRKTFTQRAMWIKTLLLDIKRIGDYVEADFFPLQGESCYDYFKPCQYFEVCEMSDKNLIGPIEEVPVIDRIEEEAKYEFKFSLDEIIEAQVAGLEN